MKIAKSKTTTLVITDAPALDPITVFTEDFEPGKGGKTDQPNNDCNQENFPKGLLRNRCQRAFAVSQLAAACDDQLDCQPAD